ncbi:hypothetical protein BpHYR1_005202 [Brachionus plicatilis]|uniref:Uncharacterized protein n=1 Tax=Brachionus plicatilis TaxID=10195 RepID=A0A3M7PAJ7_BRAPC|nr:hypothetical protein BpHYR1_005202 [Brachionus plicatilis]
MINISSIYMYFLNVTKKILVFNRILEGIFFDSQVTAHLIRAKKFMYVMVRVCYKNRNKRTVSKIFLQSLLKKSVLEFLCFYFLSNQNLSNNHIKSFKN